MGERKKRQFQFSSLFVGRANVCTLLHVNLFEMIASVTPSVLLSSWNEALYYIYNVVFPQLSPE